MGDEARRTCQQWHASQGGQREAGIQQHCRNRTRNVHRERLSDQARQKPLDQARGLDMRPRASRLGGDIYKHLHARIVLLVQRMPKARYRPMRIATFLDSGARGCIEAARSSALHNGGQKLTSLRRGAENHRAATQKTRGDGALQRLRRRSESGAAHLHAGHEAVLRDRDQCCIEHPALRIRWQLARDQQPDMLSESDAAYQLRAQVVTADDNRILIRGGIAEACCADAPIFMVFRIAKRTSIPEYAGAWRSRLSSCLQISHTEIDWVAWHANRLGSATGHRGAR